MLTSREHERVAAARVRHRRRANNCIIQQRKKRARSKLFTAGTSEFVRKSRCLIQLSCGSSAMAIKNSKNPASSFLWRSEAIPIDFGCVVSLQY